MKVLFLDFDGVLNSHEYLRLHGGRGICLDPVCLEYVKWIAEETGAKVVLSTSWRDAWSPKAENRAEEGWEIHRVFSDRGMEIVGKTPRLFRDREEEIRLWLESHPEVTAFGVLDDAFLEERGFLKGHFVRTSPWTGGLGREEAERMIGILGRRGEE